MRAINNHITIRNKIPCSSFYIDKDYRLKKCQIDPGSNFSDFLEKDPHVEDNIEKIITQKYKDKFISLLKLCLSGSSFSFETKFSFKNKRNLFFQIIFTPVYTENNTSALCTVIDHRHKLNHLNAFDDFSDFTAVQLRTSATHMLSMANVMGAGQAGTLPLDKLSDLLSNINLQTHKLDKFINSLHSLLKKSEDYIFPMVHVDLKTKIQNVVIVDDEAISRNINYKILKKFFESEKINAFGDSEAGFNYVANHRPDLLLLDLHMPEIDGYQFLQMLDAQCINIDVILVSSSVDTEEILRAKLYKNVRGFISKPLTAKKLEKIFDQGD